MIVGLTGYARSGKDTVADILVKDHGFVKYAFADPLKRLALDLNPSVKVVDGPWEWPLRDYVHEHGWDVTKEQTDARDFLVALGAGARERISPTVWVDAMRPYLREEPRSVVIPDVRYRNEVEMIHEYGGHVVLVDRPGVVPANVEEFSSLQEVWPCCGLRNYWGLEELRENVAKLLEWLGEFS